jgi:hypothetical protein
MCGFRSFNRWEFFPFGRAVHQEFRIRRPALPLTPELLQLHISAT